MLTQDASRRDQSRFLRLRFMSAKGKRYEKNLRCDVNFDDWFPLVWVSGAKR
jgi:hypothetical protein